MHLMTPLTSNETLAKLQISSVEGTRLVVTAMYNPKELQVDKVVPWAKSPTSRSDRPSLEFSSAEGRVMSFELMFDGFETATNVHTAYVDTLMKLAYIQDPTGSEDKKRPPRVAVKWGEGK